MKVREILESLVALGLNVKYYPNRGNAGDSLINVGFYDLAKTVGLAYTITSADEIEDVSKNDIVIIGGGGALVPEWPSTPDYISKVIDRCCKLIVLPQSIRCLDWLLPYFRSQDVVFCREKYSLSYLQSFDPVFSIFEDHDMAFHVQMERLLKGAVKRPALNLKNVIRLCLCVYHSYASLLSGKINAFRCDKEASEALLVKRRKINDFSSIARFGNDTPESSYYSAKKILELISRYDVIHSDRLHVIIAASLLGKKVYAYQNSYFKVLGVYEKSLSDRENVTLVKIV